MNAAYRVSLLAFVLAACGAKTGLEVQPPAPVTPECQNDGDCDDGLFCTGTEACREGRCIGGAPVVCTDGDECTDDSCDEPSRMCQHRPAARDGDGDGYNGPRPGHRAGDTGSCGNDCNDENASIHPGATEVCNGIDDNCNQIVDDNATFTPADTDVAVSSVETAPSGPGGIAWSGSQYISSFWGYTESKAHVYAAPLDRLGNNLSPPPRQLTLQQSDAYGAAVAWTGTVAGIVWQDRRDGDYEIYFNRLTPDGDTLGPAQRVTFAPGFSINPTITWTGREFVLAWQDERDSLGTGGYEIYAQRIDSEGRQIADNIRITNDPANSEAPVIVANALGSLAIAWLDGRGGAIDDPTGSRGIWFNTLTTDLRRMSMDLRITPTGQNVVAPTLVWNRDRWVIAWHDADPMSPDHEIWATTRDAGGLPIVAPRRLTDDSAFSRYPNLVPLGDRLLATWADTRGGNGYEIWARMFDTDLQPLSAETQVTHAPRDSVYPVAALGPEGDVGILFRDQREGPWRVRFTRLQCAIPH